MTTTLIHGECLAEMAKLEAGSIDLVLTDPPYGTMKGVEGSGIYGNYGAKKHEWDTTIDRVQMFSECNRLLRCNGGLIVFCQDPYTGALMTNPHGNLPFRYRLTWLKDRFAFALGCNKAPVNYTEDICVFFKRHAKHDFNGEHPLRDYSKIVMDHIGESSRQVEARLGHSRAEHFFRVNSSQFSLCTESVYLELVRVYKIDKMKGFAAFDELRKINMRFRDVLRRRMIEECPKTFNLPIGEKYKSNVLSYKKDYTGHHPTQKPVALIEDLIKTYTNEGDTVLDFTMGSGTTGVACKNLNRNFIGIEMDDNYFKIAQDRINAA